MTTARTPFVLTNLGTQFPKDRAVQPRLLFRQLRQGHGIIEIKDKVGQGLWDTGIRVVRHGV
jgi:hypothetical protein